MLKLLTTLLLGAFLIYGLDEMQVISADGFQIKDEPVQGQMAEVKVEEVPMSTSFTNRIVQLREQQKEIHGI